MITANWSRNRKLNWNRTGTRTGTGTGTGKIVAQLCSHTPRPGTPLNPNHQNGEGEGAKKVMASITHTHIGLLFFFEIFENETR